ncbi:hypothetical protein [Streptomyces ardesiacus]|uniref:hypothetical protein n=1 Tax=Streptomyces ardesiacus TaxID=285564 RepID=UPI003647B259
MFCAVGTLLTDLKHLYARTFVSDMASLDLAPEDAPGCEDPYDVESWKQGESHVFCETYVIPADATGVEVHWSEEDGEPYVWTFPQ